MLRGTSNSLTWTMMAAASPCLLRHQAGRLGFDVGAGADGQQYDRQESVKVKQRRHVGSRLGRR